MVKRSLDSIESSDFGVPFWINRYRSHVMPDDLIGPDIDPVGDHDDLRTTRSMNSFDSGVSLKSDQSKAGIILFEDSSPLRDRLRKFLSSGIISCLSVRRKDSQGCTADVKDTPPSPKEKPDDLIGPDIDPVRDHDDLMAERNRLSIESFDSGVSFKSDWSKDVLIDFKEGVSLSRLDLSSFEKKHDVSDDGFSESPDVLRAARRTLSEPAKSGFHIPLRQQSHLMMAHRSVEAFGSGLTLMNDSFIRPRQRCLPRMVLRSVEAFGSGLSLMNDSFIRTGQHSPPREEMNQELSSEVGWKHG